MEWYESELFHGMREKFARGDLFENHKEILKKVILNILTIPTEFCPS